MTTTPIPLYLSRIMVLNVSYKLLNVTDIKQQMFLLSPASNALTHCAQQFPRMCRDVYDNLHTKLQMPSSNGISLITTDLKVKNIILLAILLFYTHSTKMLPQKKKHKLV